jgi:hypothetical protein
MRIGQHLFNALAGWLAGAIAVLLCGLIGPAVFPGLVQTSHYAFPLLALPVVVGVVLFMVSPLALIAGLVGGSLPREGGQSEQILAALVFGVLIALPVGCVGLWYFSGP